MNSFGLGNDQAESSWLARSDETERGHRDDHEQSLKTLQSDHQDRGHDEEHQRDDDRERPVNIRKFSPKGAPPGVSSAQSSGVRQHTTGRSLGGGSHDEMPQAA
ncbi:MAG: hypothetical protein H0W34_00465 [Pyrinomonadaceae bacterium]|jgi:hypothetical protein|nr:hypothetical protein [Pyrinomonadaceae bacterium]